MVVKGGRTLQRTNPLQYDVFPAVITEPYIYIYVYYIYIYTYIYMS